MRLVSSELHLRSGAPWTVTMHKTSNNHWFTFAFNYCLAHTPSLCGCMCVCVCLSVRVRKCGSGTHRVHWQGRGTSTLTRASQYNSKPQSHFCYLYWNKRSNIIQNLLLVNFSSLWLQILSVKLIIPLFCLINSITIALLTGQLLQVNQQFRSG